MAIVTLADVKAHLGVTLDDDDTLITGKIDAAQALLEQLLGYTIEAEFPSAVPADLCEAVRQLAAHMYENREATTVGVSAAELPLGVWDIVASRRNYSWADSDA